MKNLLLRCAPRARLAFGIAFLSLCGTAAPPAEAIYLHPVYDRYMPQGAKAKDLRVREEVRKNLTSAQRQEIMLELEAEHTRKVAANGGKDIEWSGVPRNTGGTNGRAWGNHELWLEQCFNGVKPTYESLVRWQYRLSLETKIRRGGEGGQEDMEPAYIAAYKPVVDRRIGIRFDHLEAKATDERLSKLGLNHLVGKGLDGIEFEQNRATIFLANKGTEACVVHVTGTQPQFRRLLENNGLGKDWLSEADGTSFAFTSKLELSLYPARFAWPGSVNLRLVESTWKGKEFKAWWLMKGSYGIDDESVSRVQAHQDEGSAWVSKNTASPSDLARLGLKSASDTFPPYLQQDNAMLIVSGFVDGLGPWITKAMMPDRPERSSEAQLRSAVQCIVPARRRRMATPPNEFRIT